MSRHLWFLSWRHAMHHKGQTAILITCIGLALFLPITTSLLVNRYQEDLAARAKATPLLLGAKGNRTDLTLAALYFELDDKLETVRFGQVAAVQASGEGLAIPLSVRHRARGFPVVGTSPDYYMARRLRLAAGTTPMWMGDVTLGSEVAAKLALGPGDAIFSDPEDVYDIARPPSLKMKVAGVFAPSGTPDDAAVFVDVSTVWILEGAAHGHDAADSMTGKQVLGKKGNKVALSPAVREFQEVTEDNAASFHVHGKEANLPLTAVMILPHSAKAATMLKARVNLKTPYQVVVPTAVIEDLMQVVFKIKRLLDSFALVLGVSTALMLLLQVLLSMRLRQAEMNTLNRMGCSPGTVGWLYATEIVLVVVLGAALAAALVALALWLGPTATSFRS